MDVTWLVSVSLTVLLGLFGGFRYIQAQGDALRRELTATKEGAHLFAEKVGESEAAQRHAANNQIQIILSKFESDIRTLQRESVRQDQMDALERRLGTLVGRLEVKVDKLTEASAEIIAIKQTMQHIAVRMDRINEKLDGRNS